MKICKSFQSSLPEQSALTRVAIDLDNTEVGLCLMAWENHDIKKLDDCTNPEKRFMAIYFNDYAWMSLNRFSKAIGFNEKLTQKNLSKFLQAVEHKVLVGYLAIDGGLCKVEVVNKWGVE